ncbi:Rha family transcriptional regulator [Alcaligenes faecalis]|uniref:Rha family transcriptional regulator n=1 Tax=Alcaligenes faecalis TaxID=511 RepID=UPI002040C419|nr:Rha family transcriptional regulator [Alcaligenes faecalis]MCM2621290.1 Rha family transcriptional regulator [Alcaligenes faecalis]
MATTKEKGRDSGKSATQTTSTHDTALALVYGKDEPRIDSRLLAQHLGNTHKHVRELLTDYTADFRELGVLRFETAKPGRQGGRPEHYALLNEDQAYLLLAYSRNTPKVRQLKIRLVKAFREARQAQEMHRTDYLPTYAALHDEIQALAAGSANERFVHLNINKLINKAVGIEAGQRGRLGLPHKSMVTAAQFIASQAMRGATDHKEGYRLVKLALERFNSAALGVSHA